MKWLVLIDGEKVWVDEQPIWRVDPYKGEMATGFLTDGTKVKKVLKHKKKKKKRI